MRSLGQILMALWIGLAVLTIAWGEIMMLAAAVPFVAWIVVRQIDYRRQRETVSPPSQ